MDPPYRLPPRASGQASSPARNSLRAVCVAPGACGRCPTVFAATIVDARTAVEATTTDAATTDPTTIARVQEHRILPTGPGIPIGPATTTNAAGATTTNADATATAVAIPATAHVTASTGATTTDAASLHATS